jgi:hypothetical protein
MPNNNLRFKKGDAIIYDYEKLVVEGVKDLYNGNKIYKFKNGKYNSTDNIDNGYTNEKNTIVHKPAILIPSGRNRKTKRKLNKRKSKKNRKTHRSKSM